MRIRVLGAAAGGGFPQWNCGCANCADVRRGDPALSPRSQDSIAVSADGDRWVLLNASPDIRSQVEAFPALRPRAPRHSPIAGIVLTNGDLDHVLGLFSLRESQPLVLFATAAVRAGLGANVFLHTLERFDGQLVFRALVPGQPIEACGLELLPFAVAGKRPLHLERLGAPTPEDNIGLVVRDAAGGSVAYVPGAAALDAETRARLESVDVLFFDGTFWSSDELPRLALGRARAEDMAHLPIDGAAGSLAILRQLRTRRKIYTHINNTNPILRLGAPERRAVEDAGIEVAVDGLELAP
jgi:pyrroloquinoline quinone biosynthesis protein B